MFVLWGIGHYLKANYDVRYQLNPRTQQLELVRNIFGSVFTSKVNHLSEFYAAGVLSTWTDTKAGREWKYAVCLVTKSARMVRVSSYLKVPPSERTAEIASKLGIEYFDCGPEAGNTVARLSQDGKVSIGCAPPSAPAMPDPSQMEISFATLLRFFAIGLAFLGCLFGLIGFMLWVLP